MIKQLGAQTFYSNFKKLNKETQNRIVIQNEDEGFWNPVNLFKYFHVYLNEKYEDGMVLSYYNIADERNPGSFGSDAVEPVVNIGLFMKHGKVLYLSFYGQKKNLLIQMFP